MKNALRMIAITALIPVAVFAQNAGQLDSEVNAELDKMYSEQNAAKTQAPTASTGTNATGTNVQVNIQAQPTAASSSQATQSATAGQEQGQVQAQVVKQPTTVIEASPLTESKAETIRKARQDAELATEQTIVEKLEMSRMEDEKRRAEVLFGDKFNALGAAAQISGNNNTVNQTNTVVETQQAVVAPVVEAPVVVATPVVVAAEVKEEKIDRDAIRGEVSAALNEMKSQSAEKAKNKMYVGTMLGVGDYPEAINVRGQYAAGLSIGQELDNRMVVEGSFLYSNYQVEQVQNGCFIGPNGQCYPRITDMNQYSGSGLVKYQILGGSFRPVIGGLASYTYRSFTDSQFGFSNAEATSHALDLGLMTGADLTLSQSFSLGIDFRYMWNLTNRVDSGFQQSFVQPALNQATPIEELNYYTLSVSGRFTF